MKQKDRQTIFYFSDNQWPYSIPESRRRIFINEMVQQSTFCKNLQFTILFNSQSSKKKITNKFQNKNWRKVYDCFFFLHFLHSLSVCFFSTHLLLQYRKCNLNLSVWVQLSGFVLELFNKYIIFVYDSKQMKYI